MCLQNLRFPGSFGVLPAAIGRSAGLLLHAYIFAVLAMFLVLLTGPAYPADDDSPGAKPTWLPSS